MPVVKVTRAGVRSRPRQTALQLMRHTTLTVMPMTLDRVGYEAAEGEGTVAVTSLAEAFTKFRPSAEFVTSIHGVDIAADLEFRSLKDFEPTAMRRTDPGKRNDMAALQRKLDLLHRMREQFTGLAVKRAWEEESHRREIVEAVGEFREVLSRLARDAGGAA